MKPIKVIVKDIYVEQGKIVLKASKKERPKIRLRKFQENLVRLLSSDIRFIGLEAPTGSGKTFALLSPLISNILFNTRFEGAAGVYPTKPLTNDQFISLRNILDELGTRVYELRGSDDIEVGIKYKLNLKIIDEQEIKEKDYSGTVGLVRLTREVLDKLQEKLKEIKGRISLLNLIRETFLDADYIITVAVPEYPYLMLSFLYREVSEAQRILSLIADGDIVYRFAREVAENKTGGYFQVLNSLREVLFRTIERERLNIYSALFSEILFLDEFHTWIIYEKPTVLAFILLHYLESLRSIEPSRYKIIFSSATPQNTFYKLIEELGLGEVKVIKVEPQETGDRIKSKAIVEFIPYPTNPLAGVISWFKLEDTLPLVVEQKAYEIASSKRAIVFGRRNAIVEENAKIFYNKSGKIPVVITGIKPPSKFYGKEILEERKDKGELYVFGNYSVELGVDLKKIKYGIVYGVYLGEVVQRFGRIGRGDVDEAYVVIPIPLGYGSTLRFWDGKEIDYNMFVGEVLDKILPQTLGITTVGSEFILKSKIGKARLYLPLATYIAVMSFLWEYIEDYQKLCKAFVMFCNKLQVTNIFKWLKFKVSKSPNVLVPIVSFRIATSIPYIRDGERGEASLSTLLANYEVVMDSEHKVLRIVHIMKKRVREELSIRQRIRYMPKELGDCIISSKLFMKLMKRKISDDLLPRILENWDIPIYIAIPNSSREKEVYSLFNAFGYAIMVSPHRGKVEEGTYYLLLL